MTERRDWLKLAALLFALVATASAEYELARAVGFNQWVAAAVPGALDIYTVRAMRAHRDVLVAIGAMIGVNAASHLVTAGLIPVNVPLVVAVSAIAPLVLWRVHSIGDQPIATPVAVEREPFADLSTFEAPPQVEAPATPVAALHAVPAEVAARAAVSALWTPDHDDAATLLTVADVARERGVADATVRSWVARGRLVPTVRQDGRPLFAPAAVAALAKAAQ